MEARQWCPVYAGRIEGSLQVTDPKTSNQTITSQSKNMQAYTIFPYHYNVNELLHLNKYVKPGRFSMRH